MEGGSLTPLWFHEGESLRILDQNSVQWKNGVRYGHHLGNLALFQGRFGMTLLEAEIPSPLFTHPYVTLN